MPTQNNTITNAEFKQGIKDIRHDMKMYLLAGIGVFIALLIALGLLIWDLGREVNTLQVEVDVLQTQHATKHP